VESVTVVATPHNPSAQSLVLSLSDLPSGYALEEEDSGPLEFSPEARERGAVDGYEVMYTDWDLIFSGTPLVYNFAVVLTTPQVAHSYFEAVGQATQEDPGYSRVSCPTLGDETSAYRGVFEEDEIDIVAYVIVFRKDNLTAAIFTDGLLGAAEFDTALSFAQTALDKMNNQIAMGAASIRTRRENGGASKSRGEFRSGSSMLGDVLLGVNRHAQGLWMTPRAAP
jgi:hypothetical protein